jgi:DNA polymerase-3 subunit gamma/tau
VENLALKYRPRTWDDILGQKAVSQLLKQMALRGVTPNVLLMVGPRGSGKTSTARVLGAALNCEEDAAPCGKCESCHDVFEGISLSYREIDASTNGLVADIRALQDQILYEGPGKYTTVVLDEAHGLSSAASNALLKTLEECPKNVIFILVSTEPDKIMSTIRSRCMTFQFRHVAPEVVAKRLYEVNQLEGLSIDSEILIALADRSDGALRDALMSLDQLSRAGITSLEDYQQLYGQPDFAPYLIEAMADGDHVRAFEILDECIAATGNPPAILASLVRSLKEIMIIKGGGKTNLKASSLKIRAKLAKRLSEPSLFAAMRTLWDLKVKLRVGEDSSSALSMAVAVLIPTLRSTDG